MRGNREGQADVHAAAVALDWSIQKLFDFGKPYDLIKLSFDLSACHCQDRTIEEDVFPPSQLRMKARANLEQARDSATNTNAAFGRLSDAAQDLQESRLTAAVATDDADH